jgi:hypothetical protein
VEIRVSRLDTEVTADQAKFFDLIDQLVGIPGVSRLSALTILSEIGTDMSRFKTQAIWSPGQGCAPARTKAPASANRRGCARALPG